MKMLVLLSEFFIKEDNPNIVFLFDRRSRSHAGEEKAKMPYLSVLTGYFKSNIDLCHGILAGVDPNSDLARRRLEGTQPSLRIAEFHLKTT
jgi:hypothetical protein